MNPLFQNDTLTKVKTLVIINILEPVTKRAIIRSLGDNISSDQVTLILNELIADGFIARDKVWYRITYKGTSFTISRKANILRDIQRMKRLLKLGKQRGGEFVGR